MVSIKTGNTLKKALGIRPGEVVSLVGGGGKTTLMYSLAQEMIVPKNLIISTTTTKIFPPSSFETSYLLLSREEKEIVDFILKNINKFRHITLASEKLAPSGKLRGINPELVSKLSKLRSVNNIIVEADGAAGRSLKAPNPAYEPVIPRNTSLVVPVVGIDALGCKLAEEYVFRSKIAAQLTGKALGEIVSSDTIATLMTHPSGICKGSPNGARIIPFINKVDRSTDVALAKGVAFKILDAKHPQIDRVILGRASLNPPVVEVIFQ